MIQNRESAKPDPNRQFIVLVGLMGSGKTSIGRRISEAIGLPFVDTDEEVVKAAGCPIPEIFSRFGEDEFRNGERRVIRRILEGAPAVVASGGGSYMDAGTRQTIAKHGVTIWLRAGLDTLVERTRRKNMRPLLRAGDPRKILARLMEERHPVYAEADIIVDVGGEHADQTAKHTIDKLNAFRNSSMNKPEQ
ncbi:MAG: shikimate kinase [Pseudomonadota bacterium]|nr:shikimate kinase [Pseudomonadota bacterium]